MFITLKVYAKIHADSYSIDGGEVGTEREVHTLPHTRQATDSANYGGAAAAAEGHSGASRSIWPGEELCGLSFTQDGCCRHGEVEGEWRNKQGLGRLHPKM